MQSIFRRKQETYIENPQLTEWIRADVANPLHHIDKIIDRGVVLDVGCGTGILSRLLAGKSGLLIDGVDPGVAADHPGVQSYRHFYSSGIEALIADGSIRQYDWIVLADVIEHFPYPDELLASLAEHTKPGVRFIISTPNVAHLSVRLDLLRGRFDYVPSGILESTHLRLMTLDSLRAVLQSAGLRLEQLFRMNRLPAVDALLHNGWCVTSLWLLWLLRKDPSVYTYQFLVVAGKGQPGVGEQVADVGSRGGWACLRMLMARLAKGARFC